MLYLGHVASRRGDAVAAAAHYRQTIQLCRDSGDRYHLPYALEASAWLTRGQVDGERAAQLYGAAAAVRASTQAVLAPHEAADREHKKGTLRKNLGAAAFERGWAAGQRMLPEEAIDLALALLRDAGLSPAGGTSETTKPGASGPQSPLSPREHEVLRLVAEGLTSKEIGERLFLSHRTVDHHLTAIYNKLGVDNRAQAVAVATREGML
jgi:DNA-binding CsgD family transcriptional regulator